MSPSPIASMTTITSTAEPPKPSCSAANGRPMRPISASLPHASSLHPLGDATILLRASNV